MAALSKDDIGIALELKIDSGADLSSATDLKILLFSPRETLSTKTAVFSSDGTDGLIRYVITAADLNTIGAWRIRGKYTLGAATKLTTWGEFSVVL